MGSQPVRVSELERNFKFEVMAHEDAGDIAACFCCGSCTAGCPIHAVYTEHDPRRLARMINLGMKKRALSSPYIWYCAECGICEQSCPQNVRFFTALKVLRALAVKEGYLPPLSINEELCSGCGICVASCPNAALELRAQDGKRVAYLTATLCNGCGICGAACPSEAIVVKLFESERILAQIESFMAQQPAPIPG